MLSPCLDTYLILFCDCFGTLTLSYVSKQNSFRFVLLLVFKKYVGPMYEPEDSIFQYIR